MLMHLMLLAYSDLNCVDAANLIRSAVNHKTLSETIKTEIVQTIEESTPHCSWDAQVD